MMPPPSRVLLATALLMLTRAAAAESVTAVIDYAAPLTLSTPLSGVISQVAVAPGDEVKRGQLLIRLDDRAERARVAGAEAMTRKLRLARDEAEREFARARTLYEKTVISDHDLKLAEIAAASASADYAMAQSRLAEARVTLERTGIRAPRDGRIVQLGVAPGEAVQNACRLTPMAVLVDPQRWVARARITPARLATLHPGQTLTVRIGETRYAGRLSIPTPVHGNVEVMVRFAPSPTAALQAGSAAVIDLPGEDRRD